MASTIPETMNSCQRGCINRNEQRIVANQSKLCHVMNVLKLLELVVGLL